MSRAALYYIDIEHPGLGTYQRIQGSDLYVVRRRALAKQEEWDRRWQQRQEMEQKRSTKERQRRSKEDQRAYQETRKAEAQEATSAAEAAIEALERILEHTLGVDDRVDFDTLKDQAPFPDRAPAAPRAAKAPDRPIEEVAGYTAPPVSSWQKCIEIFSSAAKQRRMQAQEAAAAAQLEQVQRLNQQRLAEWQAKCRAIDQANQARRARYQEALADHAQRQAVYEEQQRILNQHVDSLRVGYHKRVAGAVEQYCDLVLSRSAYPEKFPQRFQLQYREASRTLVVEYTLPAIDDLPRVKSVKYVVSRDEMVEAQVADASMQKLYDGVVYQIVIRTIHELFEADTADALDAVVFNGMVQTIDRGTGAAIRPCIVSVQAKKKEFAGFNLAAVDAKACFRKLKGMGSSQLHALAPIAPIVKLDTEDTRFIEGREVLGGVHEGMNLATMDWEDFEHLVRELFEREFSTTGAQVKVTQASRDGGVDAVILDPDPIRGGKFVVQAKRYNQTVSVSAVRDLYGTMMNEGAVKGILVTTSTFGPDSYEFAKDKPITLVEGANLLYLLQKHGTAAHIDTRARKRRSPETDGRGRTSAASVEAAGPPPVTREEDVEQNNNRSLGVLDGIFDT